MIPLSGAIRKSLLLAFILGFVVLVHPSPKAFAQEANPQYTVEEYNAYQAITAEADATKKMEMILNFVKTYPKSTLKPHIANDFEGALKNLQDAKKWTQIVTLGKQFLTVFPDDAYAIALILAAFEETKNYAQLAVFGEEQYKVKPSPELAYSLARAYRSTGNTAKLVQWAEKVVAGDPDNYEMLFELARTYGDMDRQAEADKYAKQCLKSILAAKKPEATPENTWTDYTRQIQMACYFISGNAAFKRSDYAGAISNLENSLKFNSRNGMAYYFLGQSYWQSQKIDLALMNFAKGSLIEGPTKAPARQYLENLYKQTHRNSLVGIEKIVEAAKAAMK
jgi:hypothetical protein